ncbi:hypothetical protein EVAR_14591_1 [Eumeta japonica]|uniref:Uncharacterized protein n=1 Tax=Eumeta variegata TaxID=151549 RepID=A0A4C1UUA0_EUMVA|nr:hypothetical protein EVAR_14591_1 [Eumeta japonica]
MIEKSVFELFPKNCASQQKDRVEEAEVSLGEPHTTVGLGCAALAENASCTSVTGVAGDDACITTYAAREIKK